MSNPWFSRVSLKPDSHVRAIAELLLPDHVAHDKQKPETRTARHKLMWSLFADTPQRERDFLWREDKPGRFLLLSKRRPENDLFDIESKEFAPVLNVGDRLYFSMRANPVTRRNHPTKTRETVSKVTGIKRTEPVRVKDDVVMQKLHPLRPANLKKCDQGERRYARENAINEAGREWLEAQASQNGFQVEAQKSDGYHQVVIARSGSRKHPIRFSSLELEGAIKVTEPVSFIESLREGFGSAKAFGCGLMLIRRA